MRQEVDEEVEFIGMCIVQTK